MALWVLQVDLDLDFDLPLDRRVRLLRLLLPRDSFTVK